MKTLNIMMSLLLLMTAGVWAQLTVKTSSNETLMQVDKASGLAALTLGTASMQGSLTTHSITITGGAASGRVLKSDAAGLASWGTDQVDDDDHVIGNEYQTLSRSGHTITLSDEGGSVTIPDNIEDNQPLNEVLTDGGNAGGLNATNFGHLSIGTTATPSKIYGYNTASSATIYPDNVGSANLASYVRVDDFSSVSDQAIGYTSVIDDAPNGKASRGYQAIITDGTLSGNTDHTYLTAAVARSDGEDFSYTGPMGEPSISGFATRVSGNIPSTYATTGLFIHNLRSGEEDYHIYTHGEEAKNHLEGDVYLTNKLGINGATSLDYALTVKGSMWVSDHAYKNAPLSWESLSDIRVKNIDGPYEKGLDEIAALDVINFHYKEGTGLDLPTDVPISGVVAQELQEVFPEAVAHLNDDPDNYLTIGTDPLFWAMINAIKELKARVETLEAR